ncbi:hypothetical protein AVEN_121675-1 [Araneus ventricosus]|uniref:Uncharacterized protein n=1 Tax=Araneus ventricosus TaxID=182803 RepID=A0A4Y2WGE3_ARAVE|nr:hypothetical protein AVEN_121675-1 [Araneus ventricosus]
MTRTTPPAFPKFYATPAEGFLTLDIRLNMHQAHLYGGSFEPGKPLPRPYSTRGHHVLNPLSTELFEDFYAHGTDLICRYMD